MVTADEACKPGTIDGEPYGEAECREVRVYGTKTPCEGFVRVYIVKLSSGYWVMPVLL
jgi:hypothetical protein